MIRLTGLVLLLTVAAAMYWEEYKIAYSKSYGAWEEIKRIKIYYKNLKVIFRHNDETSQGLHTYLMGVNQFTDMTHDEFRSMKMGLKVRKTEKVSGAPVFLAPASTDGLPRFVDWRQKGWVTPPKEQGGCGSCWAFSATGAMEGQHFNKTGRLVSLSEQQLVDCSRPQGNEGCDGGYIDNAFRYVISNSGIDTESAYPYKAKDGDCHYKKDGIGASFSSYMDVQQGSEEALQLAVATVGPVSVGIDASDPNFQGYSSGVYSYSRCNATELDHGVLLVGYGTLQGIDYWLVKNSWGPKWGLHGYMLMKRNDNNMCGIATMASFPLV